tara:strand:- start:553 stop:756 length:204 start_codon:yes stop_codon:yes gene_type:complete
MKLFFNPLSRKRKGLKVWNRMKDLSNFTWKNKERIDKLDKQLNDLIKTQNEVMLMLENLNKSKKSNV